MRILIFFLVTFLATNFCLAQNANELAKIRKLTNVEELKKRSSRHAKEYEKMLEKVYGPGNKKPTPKKGVDNDQKFIVEIDSSGNPVYATPLDSDGNVTIKSTAVYSGGALNLNIQGESMTAGVWDDGNVRTSHIALENRAINLENSSFADHATFVTGQIIASGDYSPTRSYGKAIGVAYKANARCYNSGNFLGEVENEAAEGLLVSNFSFGSSSGSFYGQVAQKFDSITMLAPYHVPVVSAGNANIPSGVDQINYYSTGKNTIAVSSVKSFSNYTGPSSVVRSALSSRGPSDDGRVKPDLAANGSQVAGILANESTPFLNNPSGGEGTSFSAPQVTGAILLLQQHYNNLNFNFMRSSTVKGLMLHTASEAGNYPGPDITFGWGVLNVEKSAEAITENGAKSFIQEVPLPNGLNYSRELVASGSEPLIATICWTDIPGASKNDNDTTRVLINDFDARITSGGTVYYPWKLDWSNGKTSSQGPALQGDNNRDNIEKIEIANPVPGQVYTLNINHKGVLQGSEPMFSLIVTGLEQCVANRNILSNVNMASVDHQQASSSIRAQNTINSISEVVYHAGDEVVMTTGFTALNGSVYRAYIEGCTNEYNARKGVVERPVVTYNLPARPEEIALPDNAVYPNPGNGVFKVKLSGMNEGSVQVVGLEGTEYFMRDFKQQKEMEVNIKDQVPGIYIIKVFTGDKVLMRRIIKN